MKKGSINARESQSPNPRLWVRLIAVNLLMPLILFLCAGDFYWWQAWAFAVMFLAASLGGRLWAEHRHPGLLAERAKFKEQQDMKPWDKILSPLMAVSLTFPPLIVAGLDHRFGWSPAFTLWLNLAGLLLIGIGYAIGAWALAENRFFAGVVRIQTERGHQVCDSGPYRIVRHPGYAGNLLALPGLVLALGSTWTLFPAAAALLIAVIRTTLEDCTLQEELLGYREYARQVRFQLFPGIY